MSYLIKNFDDVSRDAWNAFVESSDQAWLWHTYDFIIAKSSWHNHTNKSFAVCKDGEIQAIFPLCLISSKIFRVFEKPILENIGGWAENTSQKENISEVLWNEFLNRLKSYSCLYGAVNFATTSLNLSINPFFELGLSSNTSYTSVLDLKNPLEELWKNFRKGHRSEIKKAQNAQVQFQKAVPEDLDLYYDMHKQTCARSFISPHPKSYFEYIFETCIPQKLAFVGAASLNGKIVAMVNYGLYKKKAVYWTGACFDDAYKVGANHFLHWIMMQNLIKENFTHLDMGEVFKNHPSSKAQGISDFKRGFGGDLFPIYRLKTLQSSLLSFLVETKQRK